MMQTDIKFRSPEWQGVLLAKMFELGWQWVGTPVEISQTIEGTKVRVSMSHKMGIFFNGKPSTKAEWDAALAAEYQNFRTEFPELQLPELKSEVVP